MISIYFVWFTGFLAGVGFGMIITQMVAYTIMLKFYKEYTSKNMGLQNLDFSFLKGLQEVMSEMKKPAKKFHEI